jgi:hypothetical protein
MAKWSIRDLWGRLTQKKQMNPEMKNMLLSLDGVYDPKRPGDAPSSAHPDVEAHQDPRPVDTDR